MSFKSYAYHEQPDGSLLLRDPQPLVFSGRHGLIARFVAAERSRADQPWKLCTGELHRYANPSFQHANRRIVFEQAVETQLEMLILETVTGVCGQHTDMIFAFETLRVLERVPVLRVKPSPQHRVYTEELSLDGGPFGTNCSWRWRKPTLALGGVICGQSASAVPMA